MTIASGVVVFVMCWWICFFAVLPDGAHTPGTEEGAPVRPMIWKKALWASIGAAVLTAIAAVVVPLLLAE